MDLEKIARDTMANYEKPIYDYHYTGKVIYPEDAIEMMLVFYDQMIQLTDTDRRTGPRDRRSGK